MTSYDWYLSLKNGGGAEVMQMEVGTADKTFTQEELGSALVSAVDQQDVQFVAFLLSHGAPIDENAFLAASRQMNLAIYQEFLRHGWDINSRTPYGTSIGLVVSDTKLVSWFLDHGADPNLASLPRRVNDTSWGGPFLPLPTAIVHRSWETVELLLSRGCEVDDKAMITCIEAVEGNDISKLEYLVERGGNVNARRKSPPFVQRGGHIVTLGQGETLLHLAVRRKNPAVVSFLVGKGADVHARSQRGRIPADIAEELGQQEIMSLLQKVDATAKVPSA